MGTAVQESESAAGTKVAEALMSFIGNIPESQLKKSKTPAKDAARLAKAAAIKTSVAAGGLALPPGPLGWLTILPELIAVWKIQAQLVADVAAVYGKKGQLTEEQMIYCLFRHTAAQAVRDLVVRVGERMLVRRASTRVIRAILQKIGIKVGERVLKRGLSRWLPLIGAAGVAGYAYYDTNQVGKTAAQFFSGEIDVEEMAEA